MFFDIKWQFTKVIHTLDISFYPDPAGVENLPRLLLALWEVGQALAAVK